MTRSSVLKNTVITAVCIALCLVLPLIFHSIPNAGKIFSPMHIPVLLCGLISGPLFGAVCGLIGPSLSSLLMNMPIPAALPAMAVELAVYGFAAGLLMKFIHTKKLYADLYISLVCAMLIGRIAAGCVSAFIFSPETFAISAWMTSYFVVAWPGMVIQLAIIPSLVVALISAKLIPKRYGEK